ncbi:hypothetical protein C0991_006694 [Blastosporella zonata]|nr:hypothetical protein C0991_006694 [Blastosporella zonata]
MSSPTSVPTIKLNNGVTIPVIGHGAWAPDTDEARTKAKAWLLTAIKTGYRHIDTAQGYYTEGVVGEAIKESGIPREQFFITTKLSPSHHDVVEKTFEQSLKALGVDYVDLDEKKNPDGSWKVREDVTFHQSWAELEKLLEAGKAKAIGVSNFSVKTLEELATTAKVTPAVNQVELHPYVVQEGLREYCDKKGIVLTAYSPSGYDVVREDPVINELAGKYNVTANQITLAWHIARNVVIIPKSSDEQRQKENITLPTLDAEDVATISKLDRNQRLCNAADKYGQVYGWSIERMGW